MLVPNDQVQIRAAPNLMHQLLAAGAGLLDIRCSKGLRPFLMLAAFLLTDRPGIDTKKTSACHGIAKGGPDGGADLVLPVFAVIVTGWLAGWVGYISRSLADGLVHFAYNVAMPALLVVTIAQESARNLLEWRFLPAFGGGSVLCFALVFLAVRTGWGRDLRSSTIYGMTAAMTNTGFVALPILHAIYGQPAVLPAAVATVFVAAVMFPATVILLELEQRGPHGRSARAALLAKQIVLNPMVLSTLLGLVWTIAGLPLPASIVAYLNIFAGAF